MAEIYKGMAYDPAGIKRTVCIKKILSHIAASREFIDMLVDEAKIAVKLNHGNIAQVYDLGKAGEDYFIVMEFVEGQSLSKIFKKVLRLQKKIPIPTVCYLIAEIASGLNYMHRKTDEEENSLNIIHRDISPQNIVVSYSGTVKIIDFGIAKAAVKIGHTDSGVLKGKFAYMSPEQARGDRLDHRSDVFSLGVIFHELLTGKRLFKTSDNKQTLRNVRRAEVAPPSQWNPEVPPELDGIALKALAKDRRHRYAFASDFQDDLLKFLHTNYPDFKPQQAADFVRDLFKEERTLQKKISEAEGQTPHLILDKTRTGALSADESQEGTAGGAKGIDWREFMLDADWPAEEVIRESEIGSRKEEGEELEESESFSEKTARKWVPPVWIFLGVSITFLIIMGFFLFDSRSPNHDSRSTPARREFGGIPEPRITLKTAPLPAESITSKIQIISNPSGASVYMNDKDTGQVTPTELYLDGGKKYTLGLYLTNYKFFKTELETKPGEKQNFHVELALDFGSLKITSEPNGAKVYRDDHFIGETPLIKEDLKPGEITHLRLELEGFAIQTEEFQVAAGKQKTLHFQMERLPNLPPAEQQPIMENSNETKEGNH